MREQPVETETSFQRKIVDALGAPLRARGIELLMLNVGLRCTMECAHCHHACSPTRTEMMGPDTVDACIELAAALSPALVDITGGAPELNPDLPRLIAGLRDAVPQLRIRTNLTALRSPAHGQLIDLFAEQKVRVLASLPGATAPVVDSQRGVGVFAESFEALRSLNDRGYGDGDGLLLDIAYNPPLGELPRSQASLEAEMRSRMAAEGIQFDRLLRIANVPVGRLAAGLRAQGMLDSYVESLVAAWNAETLPLLCCTRGIEVAWDGTLWDCDFNLAAGLPLAEGPRHISEFDVESASKRRIAVGTHCFACTADEGSS
jgi:radical SAM/Cys-rich protein